MDDKKMSKRGALNMFSLIFSFLVIIGVFGSMFLYLNQKATEGGVVLDSKYNDTFIRLNNVSNELDDRITQITSSTANITEQGNAFTVAYNGLRNLGNTLLLFIGIINEGFLIVGAILIPLDFVPPIIKTLLIIGVITSILVVVLAILKGEPAMK